MRDSSNIVKSIYSLHGVLQIKEDKFNQAINIIANKYPNYLHDPARLKKGVCDIGMFRVGISIQCPSCDRRIWYAFNELDYELQCTKCL